MYYTHSRADRHTTTYTHTYSPGPSGMEKRGKGGWGRETLKF